MGVHVELMRVSTEVQRDFDLLTHFGGSATPEGAEYRTWVLGHRRVAADAHSYPTTPESQATRYSHDDVGFAVLFNPHTIYR